MTQSINVNSTDSTIEVVPSGETDTELFPVTTDLNVVASTDGQPVVIQSTAYAIGAETASAVIIDAKSTAQHVHVSGSASSSATVHDHTSFNSDISVLGDITATRGGFGDGSVANPSVYFATDPDTGMYRAGTNQLGFTAGGTQVLQLATTEVDMTTDHLNVISNTGSPTINLGGWAGGGNYAAIETDTGYLILGNGTGGDEGAYLQTKSTGKIYLGTNGGNDLTIANGGNVGIGTTTPSQLLDIDAGTSGSVELTTTGGRTIQLTANDSEPFLSVGSTSAHGAAIMTNGVRRLSVDSSGKVGIGTTAPNKALDVVSSGTAELSIRSTTSVGDSALLFGNVDDIYQASILYDASDQSLKLRGYNNSTRLTIANAGDVGIGTTSPTKKLHVNGDALVSGVLNCSHLRGDETTQYFGPSDSWEMSLTSSGLVPYINGGAALGSTSKYWNGVYSSNWFRSSGAQGWFNQTYSCGLYSTQAGWIRTYGSNVGFITNSTVILGAPSNTTTTSGSLYIRRNSTYGTLHTYSSTRELKENVQSINPAESGRIIDMLRPVTYIEKYRSGPDGSFVEGVPDTTNETAEQYKLREWDLEYGFIAEELDALEPEGVKLASYDWQQIDDEGFPKPNGWKDSNITAILVAEVKELRKRLAVLEEVHEHCGSTS